MNDAGADGCALIRCQHVAVPASLELEGCHDLGVVRGLCEGKVPRLAERVSTRVLVAVCGPLDPDGAWMGELRRQGAMDPLVRVLVLDSEPDAEVLNVARMRAASVRLLMEEPSGLHHVRPRWGMRPGTGSRRALLGLPPLGFDALPSVDSRTCAAEAGCRSCLNACPHVALSLDESVRVSLDATSCTACGRCVTACPTRATTMLGYDLAGVEAEVEVLQRHAPGTPVVFACRRRPSFPGWAAVEVPCAGAVTPGMVFGTFALGAIGVAVAHCGESCRSGEGETPRETVVAVSSVWDSDPSVEPPFIRFVAAGQLPPEPNGTPVASVPLEGGWATHAGLGLRALWSVGALPSRAYERQLDGIGRPQLDAAACTRCGSCARACPTGAIGAVEVPGGTGLSVDHARCVGCGLCVLACPERERGAIRLEPGFAPWALEGATVAVTSEELRCERCGGPVAPREMIQRLREILGPDFREETMARRCTACRALA